MGKGEKKGQVAKRVANGNTVYSGLIVKYDVEKAFGTIRCKPIFKQCKDD